MTSWPDHPGFESGRSGRVHRIAGVVVLYRPGADLMENIASYLDQVEILFAVDNSEHGARDVAETLQQTGKVVYIANGKNLGVARALNVGAQLALEQGFDFLLTMDQDSRAASDMVGTMLACLGTRNAGDVGIIAPFHATKPGMAPAGEEACREVLTAMTSGNLLNLAAYRAAGPFLDELFVDFVDIEYCLRLRGRGFRVIRANRAVLEHHVGHMLKVSMFSRDFRLTSHNPLRKYYKTRNRFVVTHRYEGAYPAFCRADRIRFFLELLRLILFENDKREKLAMMCRGYADYRRGKLGKFDAGNGGALP